MASLLDIAPLTKTVSVQGKNIEVGGVSALGIAHLLRRFPEVRRLFSGQDVEFTEDRIFDLAPDAVKAIIAAGAGAPGDEKMEEAAERLSVGDQMDLISAIIELTMPEGVGPFVVKVRSLLSGANGVVLDVGGKGQDTK